MQIGEGGRFGGSGSSFDQYPPQSEAVSWIQSRFSKGTLGKAMTVSYRRRWLRMSPLTLNQESSESKTSHRNGIKAFKGSLVEVMFINKGRR